MREPGFWRRRFSILSATLWPVAMVYGAIAGRRMAQRGVVAGVPVICVGNYHLGGAGKTPTVLALVDLLRELGESPVVLSRGYGGRLKGPVAVDATRHTAQDIGDEPLMMAARVPVVVARDRVGGAALARAQGASVIVMDDGFQNPSLHKSLSFAVIDAARGLGNGRIFPAGPLRAPLRTQIAQTDALIVIGEGLAADRVMASLRALQRPVFRAQVMPQPKSLAALRGQRVLAFAGIGDPPKFFRTLRAAGIDVAAARSFDDHHAYTDHEMAALRAEARAKSLALVTTEKDAARYGVRAADVATLAVSLTCDDPAAFAAFVRTRLAQARTPDLRT